MNLFGSRKIVLIHSLLLAILMAVTRFHPIGSSVGLHDASLAVFFLSGLSLGSIFFPLFLAEATLIDYMATLGGGDAWCITPAYLFLIPTYATLWWAGRWYARRHCASWRTLFPLAGALWVGAGAAFLISNAGFYFFSGYFGKMSLGQYAFAVAQYYPSYVADVFFYGILAVSVQILFGAVGRFKRRGIPTMPSTS